MAGSYNHAVAADGQLLCNEDLVQMVENMGDGYETIEQMYGMIWWLATALGARYPTEDPAKWVDQARQNYRHGLDHSPGTDGHLPQEDDE